MNRPPLGKIFLFGSILLCCYSKGQEGGGHLSLVGGVAFPSGSFVSTDLSDPQAGYAKLGFNFMARFSFKLSKIGGFCLVYNYQDNGVKNNELQAAYTQKYPTSTWYVDSKPWENHYFLGGYFNSVTITDGHYPVALEFFVAAGLATPTGCTIRAAGVGPGNPSFFFGGTKTKCLGGAAGLDLRIDLTGNTSWLLGTSFTTCTPTFDRPSSSSIKTYTVTMDNLCLNTGIAFRF